MSYYWLQQAVVNHNTILFYDGENEGIKKYVNETVYDSFCGLVQFGKSSCKM